MRVGWSVGVHGLALCWAPSLSPRSAFLPGHLPFPARLSLCPEHQALLGLLTSPLSPRGLQPVPSAQFALPESNPQTHISTSTLLPCHILDPLYHFPSTAPQVCMTASPKPGSLCGLPGFRNITATAQWPGLHLPVPSVSAGWNLTPFRASLPCAWVACSSCLVPP